MVSNEKKETEVKVISDFNEMKKVLEEQSALFCEYLIAYNIKILDRTITRAEDF